MTEPVKSSPNSQQTWNAIWERDRDRVLEARTVSAIMDDIKFEYLRPLLPNSGRIVEFGCGSARLLRFAAARGMSPIGLDFSHEALMIARNASPDEGPERPDLVRCDVRLAPLASNSVDVVGSTGLLEHFERPEDVIGEMVRVLRPGGLFYSDIVPTKFSLYRSLEWLRVREMTIFERPMSKSEIEGFMKDAGLVDVKIFGAGVFPPMLPFVERFRPVRNFIGGVVSATLPLWKSLDGTAAGDLLGFYYFATGRKPA